MPVDSASGVLKHVDEELVGVRHSTPLRVPATSRNRHFSLNRGDGAGDWPTRNQVPLENLSPANGQAHLYLVATSPDGAVLGELPLILRPQETSDPARPRLQATDSSGSLTFASLVDVTAHTGTIDLSWSSAADVLPGAVLPVMRILRHLSPPNSLSMRFNSAEVLPPQPIPAELNPVPPELLQVVEELAYIQRETGAYFFMPSEFTGEDTEAVHRAFRLLKGEIVKVYWNTASVRMEKVEEAKLPPGDAESSFVFGGVEKVRIADHEVRLGQSLRHLLTGRVAQWNPDPDRTRGELQLAAGSTREAEVWLPDRLERPYFPTPGVGAGFSELLDEFMDENDEVLRRLAQ